MKFIFLVFFIYDTKFIVKKLFLKYLIPIFIILFSSNMYVNADELFNKGKEVFLGAGNCAACHMLSDAGSNAMVGPNLNEIRPDIQRILMAVRNGIGVMPAMEGMLTDEEIEAVAHYTSIAAEQ